MTITTVLTVLSVPAGIALAVPVLRFLLLAPGARRYWWLARWHRFRWQALAANLRLSYIDRHRKAVKPRPFGTSAKVPAAGDDVLAVLRFPRAHFSPDPFGWLVKIKLIPGVDRETFEKNASHLANAWGCHRIGVTQPRPGRLLVRAVRREPLSEPLASDVLPPFDGRHITLGRDEWGQLRRVSLVNRSGSVWAGNPGRGKTEAALSLAVQLAPSPLVDMHVLDGGACDWSHFVHGAASYAADDLEAAADLLAGLDAKMRARRRGLEADLGVRNAWAKGPTEDYRLQWLLMEEAPFYLSFDAVKGDKRREGLVQSCRGFTANLLRRGRAPMMHSSLLGQKITSSSIPPDLRDLCGLRWSFGTATIEAAIAALGDDVRQYPMSQPTLLQGPEHVGVASVLLPTGLSPYTLLKFPAVGEELPDRIALEMAQRRIPSGEPVLVA
jgi:S-DNA-T family DNA segregation ATPase FtsK/SpoIIIE